MVRTSVVGSVLVGAMVAAYSSAAGAAQPEPEGDAALVPEPGASPDAGEPETAPDPPSDPEPEPEPLEFSASAGDRPPPRPNSSMAEDDADGIRDFKGRFGIGVIRTIAGLNGINFRYFVASRFALGANIGVGLFTFQEDDPSSTDVCPGPDCTLENRRTVAAIAASLEGIYYARLGKPAGRLPFRADFGFGGRVGVMAIVNAQDVADNLDDATEVHIELPLIVQLMFGENFALAPEFGLDFRIVPGDREDPGDTNPGTGLGTTVSPGDPGVTNGPGFGFEITPGIGLFGGASMHYYF